MTPTFACQIPKLAWAETAWDRAGSRRPRQRLAIPHHSVLPFSTQPHYLASAFRTLSTCSQVPRRLLVAFPPNSRSCWSAYTPYTLYSGFFPPLPPSALNLFRGGGRWSRATSCPREGRTTTAPPIELHVYILGKPGSSLIISNLVFTKLERLPTCRCVDEVCEPLNRLTKTEHQQSVSTKPPHRPRRANVILTRNTRLRRLSGLGKSRELEMMVMPRLEFQARQ